MVHVDVVLLARPESLQKVLGAHAVGGCPGGTGGRRGGRRRGGGGGFVFVGGSGSVGSSSGSGNAASASALLLMLPRASSGSSRARIANQAGLEAPACSRGARRTGRTHDRAQESAGKEGRGGVRGFPDQKFGKLTSSFFFPLNTKKMQPDLHFPLAKLLAEAKK